MIDKGTAHESDESVHVLRSRMNNLNGRKEPEKSRLDRESNPDPCANRTQRSIL